MDQTIVDQLIAASEGSHWTALAGVALLILVWIFQKVTSGRLPQKRVPLINAAVAVVLAVAGLLALGRPWYEALATGALVGATAGGFWSMLGKHILPLSDKAVAKRDP